MQPSCAGGWGCLAEMQPSLLRTAQLCIINLTVVPDCSAAAVEQDSVNAGVGLHLLSTTTLRVEAEKASIQTAPLERTHRILFSASTPDGTFLSCHFDLDTHL